MRYGSVERARYGFSVDSWTYLEALPSLVDSLPVGARAFATDPGHYDFHGQRCVKDLKPIRLSVGDSDRPDQLTLELRHNCWKHEEDLTVVYHGVVSVTVEPDDDPVDVTGLGDVWLDEMLPHEHGCSHEVVGLSKSLTVICSDLQATWHEADCPDKAPGH